MKKFLFSSFLFFGTLAMANAQVGKNTTMIGGSIGFSTSSGETEVSLSDANVSTIDGPNATVINANPKIGYFFAENFAAGLGIEYSYLTTEEEGSTDRTSSDFLAGPFARYYVPLGGENFYFFVEGSLGFGTASTTETPENGNEIEGSGSLFGAGGGPGLAVFVGDQIALEGLLRYNHVSTSTEFNDDRVLDSSVNEVDVLIGINWYLNR